MTTPDRLLMLASQDRWAAGMAYRPEPVTDTREHGAEIMASHEGRPTVAQQSVSNGCGLPPVDNGPDPGSVVG